MNRIRLAAIAIGVLTIGMAILAWGLGIAPMITQTRDAEQAELTTHAELLAATQTLAALETAAARLDTERANLDLLRDWIPEAPLTAELAERFGRVAELEGVAIQSLAFQEAAAVAGLVDTDPELGARLFQLEVAMRVAGGSEAILRFIDAVQYDTRITLVHSVQLSPGEVSIVELAGATLVLGPAQLPGVVDPAEAAVPAESAPAVP